MKGLEFYFRVCLRVLILKNREDEELIKAYDLTQPNENLRRELIERVKIAMASPKETGDYEGEMEMGLVSEEIALQSVKLNGLTALVFLGEKETIPLLLAELKEDKTKKVKRQIVAFMALSYLTGEDVGGDDFSLKEELLLWERWWEQNKSTFLDEV